MKMLDKVYDIWTKMIDDETIEDRREYTQLDLLGMYQLTEEEATYLHRLIQAGFDPDVGPGLMSQDPRQIGETIQEACHQSLDGWEPGEKVIIELFLQDLGKAVKLSYDNPSWEQLNPPNKIAVTSEMYDNRDESETWLRVPGVGIIVVDPADLYKNMIANTSEQDE